MLRASALFYAVTVALVVGMITCALILLVHFRNVETERWLALQRAVSNARSGIRMAMVLPDERGIEHGVDLFGDGEDSAMLWQRPYGLLDHIAVRACAGGQWAVMGAFVGGRSSTTEVLRLGRGEVSITHLCGDARIHGNAIVPMGDVRRGYIEGRTFTGEQLVEGRVSSSGAAIAIADAERMERLVRNCRRSSDADDRLISLAEAALADTVHDPFTAFPRVDLHGLPVLDAVSLVGPLVLRSEDTLVIGRDCHLEMVIVQAPFIRVAAGAVLSVQCFADRGIHVEAGSMLRYPSALVITTDREGGFASLDIDSAAVVEGSVIACLSPGDTKGRVLVRTRPGSLVRGEVFSEGMLEHRGEVKGMASAGGLTLHTASSTYMGYLLDGVFAPSDPAIITGGLVLGDALHRDVIKWMPCTTLYPRGT